MFLPYSAGLRHISIRCGKVLIIPMISVVITGFLFCLSEIREKITENLIHSPTKRRAVIRYTMNTSRAALVRFANVLGTCV